MPARTRVATLSRHLVGAVLVALTAAVALMLSPGAHAQDAHRAVQAKHGEMVLIRSVPTRVATRPAPPGMALIVDPRPNRQIDAALGTHTQAAADGELGDADIAALGASPMGSAMRALGARPANVLAMDPNHPGAGGRNDISGAAPGGSPMGAVGNATRGIGDQVQRALGAMPFPATGGNGN